VFIYNDYFYIVKICHRSGASGKCSIPRCDVSKANKTLVNLRPAKRIGRGWLTRQQSIKLTDLAEILDTSHRTTPFSFSGQ